MGKKNTPEHEVAVVGDLIGDPYKNTVIKLLNTVAIVFVAIFFGFIGI